MNNNIRIINTLGLLVFLMSSPTAFADAASIQQNGEAVNSLIITIGYALGVCMFGGALYGYYQISSGQAQRENFRTCTQALIAGSLLVGISSAYSIFASTWLGDAGTLTINELISANPNMTVGGPEGSFMTKYIPKETQGALLVALKALGLAAFCRGVYLIKFINSFDQNNSASKSKVLAFMFGGMALINIVQFSCGVAHITGFKYFCVMG